MDIENVYTSTLASSLIFFLSNYLIAYFIIFKKWDINLRKEASSSFMSLTHGTPVVILAMHSLLQIQTAHSFASPNTTFHNSVLEFSMAYFLADLLHYLLFFPNDILFILHHAATLYVFVTCRYVVRYGGYEILVLLILAEVTNPLQNVWSIAGLRQADDPYAARLFQVLSTPFLVFYSVVRGVLGPLFVVKMGVFYFGGEGDGLIPRWAWISWMVVIVTAILVSILWVSNRWGYWFRERNRMDRKKAS
ncbi:TLC domain-containing protein At5g14285 [Mercurialis annua]|uniref:TLC domain-containing protein At5g14285 n=1 Tax=Mercurialis annua TaxID=3986 RepID=UPI00216049D9|nr:TLC domain-containing protein At5g14285 [Mercurialis annua]